LHTSAGAGRDGLRQGGLDDALLIDHVINEDVHPSPFLRNHTCIDTLNTYINLKEGLTLLGLVPTYMQCSYKKKKKESRAMAALLNCSRGVRFSSSRAFQPLHLTVSDVVAAAAAVVVVFVAAAAAVVVVFVAAGVVVVVVAAAAGVVVVVAAAVAAAAATATVCVAAAAAAVAVAVVAAAGVVVVVVAEGTAVLLAVVASAVVVVAAAAGVGVKGDQWGGNQMKDGRNALDGPPNSWVPPRFSIPHSFADFADFPNSPRQV
jgi:hypothetical protein